MTHYIRDDMDFSAYMSATEVKQRVVSVTDYADQVVSYFWDDSLPRGSETPWTKLRGKLAFRPHEVTLWSGMNGHGKSLALGQVLLGFLKQGEGSCIASLEMPPRTSLARMVRQFFNSSKPDPEHIRAFHEETGRHLYVYDHVGSIDPDQIFAVIRYCAEEVKLKHFVLDSLMKCGIGDDDYNGQKAFVGKLCDVARDTGMHIHLVAHSRKGKDELSPPGKMDVKGSGSITDQVDNVITWWRNKKKEQSDAKEHGEPDALLICDKQRNGEWEGKAAFWFDPASLQFREESYGVEWA